MKVGTKKIGIGIVLVLVAVLVWFKFFSTTKNSSAITYKDYTVMKGELSLQILSTGIVQPENKVEIKPPIAGRLERVLVKEGDRVRKGQILAWMSSTERAAMLDAASAKGPDELKEWEQMYRATPILAAINGTIIQKNVEAGQTFTVADALLVMSDRLTVKAQVDETDIAKIKIKQRAIIALDAYPTETIDAIVDQIAFDAKTVNNVTTYIVDVLPNKSPHFMRSGMTANVTFLLSSKQEVLIVPTEAIKTQDSTSFVLVANPNDQTRPIEKKIEIGMSDGKKTEVVSGLQVGDKILIQEFKVNERKTSGSNPFSPMGGAPRGGRGGH